MTQAIGRRAAQALGSATALAARAQASNELEFAMLVPLAGPWAREGILERLGAEMAVDDVNRSGGIKSLGGAKLKLLPDDTQDTAQKAKDAAQRMLAENQRLTGGFGCWLSTFTLAATEGDRTGETASADALLLRCHHRSRFSLCVSNLADSEQTGR